VRDGTRTPLSHERTSTVETPSRRANTDWLVLSVVRVARRAAASYSPGSSGSSTVRAVPKASPRSSASASPVSAPMISEPGVGRFLFTLRMRNSCGECVADPPDNGADRVRLRRGQVVLFVLRKHHHEVKPVVVGK